MPLAVHRYGSGPPLVALHGFTLGGAQFAALAGSLRCSVLAPDLPGHGATVIRPVDVPTTIGALASWMTGFDAPVPVLGYSMGGRIALSLALDRSELVTRVITVSTGPGIGDAHGRRMRAAEDAELADRIEREGVGRFLDRWLAAPMTSTKGVDATTRAADRAVREQNTAEGLAAALRGLGQGTYPYLGDRIQSLTVPLLAASGGDDHHYTEQAAALAATAPEGRHVVIPGAGHNVVLEAPGRLAEAVREFLG